MPRWCATIRPMGRLNRMRTPKQELRRGPLCSSSHCSPRFAGRGRCMCPPAPARRTMRRRQASPRRSLQLVFPCLPFSRFGRWDWPTRFEEDSAHAENGKHYLKHPSQNVDAKRKIFGSGTKNQRIGKASPARISTAQATFGAVRPFRPLCAPCLRHCRDVEVACSRGESMLKHAEKPQTLTMRLWCRSGCADDRCRPVIAPVLD